MRHPISSIVGGTRRELVDMPWPQYLDFPALNGSVIVQGRKSLRHLKWAWDKGDEDTDAMRYGRMVHCLLFEPGEFTTRYRAWDGVRRGKDYDQFLLEAAAAGAEVVPATGKLSLEAAVAAAPSFLDNSKIQSLIRAGQAEQTVLVPECGLQFKGRLDWVSTSDHSLVDLKTANEVTERQFGVAFFRYGYDLKLGLYRRWLQEVTGEAWPVDVIVLENKAPYDSAVLRIPDAVLDAGVDKAMRIIEAVRVAIETDTWPGVDGIDLYVPSYMMEEESEPFEG